MTLGDRQRNWENLQRYEAAESERLAILAQRPAANPPELIRPVRVKVLRSFHVGGVSIQPGEIVDVERALATDLVALHFAELV
jgi:hypothetical protein